MGNIFTTENISKYNTKGATEGVGEYILRNGFWSLRLKPAPFYQNYTIDDTKYSWLLKYDFQPNTQYIVDLWIDVDEVVYQEKNVSGGLYLVYTDGSSNATPVIIGGNMGFQHINFVSDASKSVSHFYVSYYVNKFVYYRADSYVAPLSNTTKINKQGILESSIINERDVISSEPLKYGKGYILSNEIIEI